MKRRNKEQALQVLCYTIFQIKYENSQKGYMFSVPNGGHRSKTTAVNLKREGQRAGVADCVLMFDGVIVFVEFKKPPESRINTKTGRMNKVQGGKQSETQKQFQEICIRHGHPYYIVDNVDEFERICNIHCTQ